MLNTCGRAFHATAIWLLQKDGLFLALLGIITALLSFSMDYCIEHLHVIHLTLYDRAASVHKLAQYVVWSSFTVGIVLMAVVLVHWISPAACGSGIPEMKTIMRGVLLRDYLSLRTLLAKMLGLTMSLGSGLVGGKEGPFVHVGCIVAYALNKLRIKLLNMEKVPSGGDHVEEAMAAGFSVGVACTFGAPVGGVLFSIEATGVYFALKNYWRGFFAAICSALVFRLLAVWFRKEATVVAFHRTSFPHEYPFDPLELLAFCAVGLLCGFGGAAWVYMHRTLSLLNVRVRKLKYFQNYLVCPGLVAFIVATLRYPDGFGQLMAGRLSVGGALTDLLTNFSWAAALNEENLTQTAKQAEILARWHTPLTNIYATLTIYIVTIFFLSALCTTVTLPAGLFMPMLVLGASFGRLVGESMAAWFPHGLQQFGSSSNHSLSRVVPGGYAVVGAAALAGSVTHTISVTVIAFELTGQIVYIIPVMLAVLISTTVASYLQPSIYDSIIELRKLPCLPKESHKVLAMLQQFTVADVIDPTVRCLPANTKKEDLRKLFSDTQTEQQVFPVIDKTTTNDCDSSTTLPIFLGSTTRKRIVRNLNLANDNDPKNEESEDKDELLKASLVSQTDDFSLQVSDCIDLTTLYRLMIRLRTEQAYVVAQSRLVGVVTNEKLRDLLLSQHSSAQMLKFNGTSPTAQA